jgi:hypothetical protein
LACRWHAIQANNDAKNRKFSTQLKEVEIVLVAGITRNNPWQACLRTVVTDDSAVSLCMALSTTKR